jgi:hypothetical protein
MKLKPLEQWYCDYCGELIASAEDGWLEWLSDDTHHGYGFKIVHHLLASPNKDHRREGCYHYGNHFDEQSMHLNSYVGPDGLTNLLALLDKGQADPEDSGPCVRSTSEFVELTRRLQTPHYEEARTLWNKAKEDGFFDGANEVWPYIQSTLKQIIKKYGRP